MEVAVNQLLDPTRRRFLKIAATGTFAAFLETPIHAWANNADDENVSADKDLIVRSPLPLNAEPSLDKLVQSWITPVKHFYVRSHAPTPKLDARTFQLSVEGLVEKPRRFSMAELKSRFPAVSAIATMICAGNRRAEHSRVKTVKGVQWEAGPIGNAEWTGISLAKLLKSVGVRPEAKHVWFESVDRIEKKGKTFPFGGSIPINKALDNSASMPGAIVAYNMNGKPLHADHGFPLRIVVPGYIGARSVKWLGRIVVSDKPTPNHFLATAYKLVVEDKQREWEAAQPIYNFPVNSVICAPAANAALASGTVHVSGYSIPSGIGGSTISRVEISTNGGKTWNRAYLGRESHEFCWRLWNANVPVNRQTKQLIVRAIDSSGATQPQTVKWNLKGYLFNAWYKVPVKVS